VQSRSWDALGMGAGSDSALRWAGGIALAIAGLLLTYLQAAQVGKSEDARKQLHDQLGDLLFFLPKTKEEFYWFKWLSLTAGICEEILYRGFLIWFIASYLGVLPAILLSAVGFGIAHSYQGFGNAVQTAVIGLWMAILFWLTGSVWIPIVTHALVDVIGGRMIYGVLSPAAPGPGGEQIASPGEG
jgi:membrane protease YdiL (CAAX protease family)